MPDHVQGSWTDWDSMMEIWDQCNEPPEFKYFTGPVTTVQPTRVQLPIKTHALFFNQNLQKKVLKKKL